MANPNAAGRGGGGGRGGFGQGGGFNRNDWFKTRRRGGTALDAPRGHGIYTIGGGDRNAEPTAGLPRIAIPAEQYGRLARMVAKNIPVTIEADIKNTYIPNPPMFNVVGEIPGTDLAARGRDARRALRLVARLDRRDRQRRGLGGDDGSDADPEAERREAAPHRPDRSVDRRGTGPDRIARLRQGALRRLQRSGRRAPGQRGAPARPRRRARRPRRRRGARPRQPGGPGAAAPQRGGGRGGCQTGYTFKPEHAKFAGYFNIDNGTGAIRGVYLQQNDAVAPIFREWIEPFSSLGMTALTIRNTGGTDHQSFDALGLPGLPVHPGRCGIRHDDAPHEPGLVRAAAAERHDEERHDRGVVRLPGGEPRREAAAETRAPAAAGRGTGQ